MTVTLPATQPAPTAPPAGRSNAATAPAEASDTPTFAQTMQATTQAQSGRSERPTIVAPKSAIAEGARKLADKSVEIEEAVLEDTTVAAGAELAAQALMLAEHTLAHRQAVARSAAHTPQDGEPQGTRLSMEKAATPTPLSERGDPAKRLRQASATPFDAEISSIERLVVNAQALANSNAPTEPASSANGKPAGAAVLTPELKAAVNATRTSAREPIAQPSALQQALAALSETGAREATDATPGEKVQASIPTEPFIFRESVATPSQQMPVFQQVLRDVSADVAPRTTLPVPVNHAQWGQALGEQMVSWAKDMRSGDLKAELRLDPPDLGPLRIALTISDGVASASFASAHASVRHALEQALPQLQAALADAGLALGNAHVGDQNVRDQDQHAASGQDNTPDNETDAAGDTQDAPLPRTARSTSGLLDVFA